MRTVLLVSRNASLAMGLASADYDVIDLRPASLDAWLSVREDVGVDAVVLDITDPAGASRMLAHLREVSIHAPVLMVSGHGPEWAEALTGDVVQSLPLPVTRPVLLAALARLLQPVPLPAEPPPDTSPRETSPLDIPAAHAWSEDPFEILGLTTRIALPDVSRHAALSAPPVDLTPVDLTPVVVEPVVVEPVVVEPVVVEPVVVEPVVVPLPVTSPVTDIALVAQLIPQVGRLFPLREVASMVVTEALARTASSASALLTPRGNGWAVSSGVGLRPLESRLTLDADTWLVATVVTQGQAVIVEDSDIVRQRMRGAPLASHRHLLAVPVPEVSSVLMVARDDDTAYTDHDLADLVSLAADATGALRDALLVRTLAERLKSFLDDAED